jgi:hypothetical protein
MAKPSRLVRAELIRRGLSSSAMAGAMLVPHWPELFAEFERMTDEQLKAVSRVWSELELMAAPVPT